MINENCPACQSTRHSLLFEFTKENSRNPLGLPGAIKICQSCQFIYKTYELGPKELYGEKYADHFTELEDYSGPEAVLFFKSILYPVKKKQPQKLIDFGCGAGVFLTVAREVGFISSGIEISPKLAKITESKGFSVQQKDILDMDVNEKYDVVSMMDIIEHLQNPFETLAKASTMLSPGGQLLVYTPNHSSMVVKAAIFLYKLGFKSPAENIFACTHTCFFTTQSLVKMLLKAGFTDLKIIHFRYNTSRPGQKVSNVEKWAINLLEWIGTLIGLNGFRVVIFASVKK